MTIKNPLMLIHLFLNEKWGFHWRVFKHPENLVNNARVVIAQRTMSTLQFLVGAF